MAETPTQRAWRNKGRSDAQQKRPPQSSFADDTERAAYWKGYRTVKAEANDKKTASG